MKFWMTQSLLNSWLYYMWADDDRTDDAWASFLSTLRRERKEPTKAMQDGILFEDIVNRLVSKEAVEDAPNIKWARAALRFAAKCMGGQSQVPVTGELSVCGMDLVLYGVCDYVKSGIIYDIKKVVRYEYGKYQHSPQHPMYLHLVPEAKKFEYLIFDGSNCHVETYRREDCYPIQHTINEFLGFMRGYDGLETYKTFWVMDQEREDKRSVIL